MIKFPLNYMIEYIICTDLIVILNATDK